MDVAYQDRAQTPLVITELIARPLAVYMLL